MHYLYGSVRVEEGGGIRVAPAARVHVGVVLALFLLLQAVNFWLNVADVCRQNERARHYQSYKVTIRTDLEHRIWRDIHAMA